MTKNERFLRKWQRILRLLDWNIRLVEVKRFKNRTQVGSTRTAPGYLEATIRIALNQTWRDRRRTIIHELLHVRFALQDHEEGSAAHRELEVGIEMVTRALLGGKCRL